MSKLIKYGLAAASFAVVNSAHAFPQDFVGTWINTSRNPNGIVRILIDENLDVILFVRCDPVPCELRPSELVTFGQGLRNPNHRRGLSITELSFKGIFSEYVLSGQNGLSVTEYNGYTDGSGRQDYWRTNNFRRLLPNEPRENFGSDPTEEPAQ